MWQIVILSTKLLFQVYIYYILHYMLALETAQIRTHITDSGNAFQQSRRAHFVAHVNVEQLSCKAVVTGVLGTPFRSKKV